MLEISDLKSKKLPELQEMAKALNVPKFRTLKKLDLVYQILDHQASDPTKVAKVASVLVEETVSVTPTPAEKEIIKDIPVKKAEKPKKERKRVQTPKATPAAEKNEVKKVENPAPVKNKTETPTAPVRENNRPERKPNPRQDKNDRNNNGHHKNKNQKNGNNRDNKGNRDIRNRYKAVSYTHLTLPTIYSV